MNIKKGKMRLVGVNLLKVVCFNGVYIYFYELGLFIRIMFVIVMFFNMLRVSNCLGVFVVMCVRLINWLIWIKIVFY